MQHAATLARSPHGHALFLETVALTLRGSGDADDGDDGDDGDGEDGGGGGGGAAAVEAAAPMLRALLDAVCKPGEGEGLEAHPLVSHHVYPDPEPNPNPNPDPNLNHDPDPNPNPTPKPDPYPKQVSHHVGARLLKRLAKTAPGFAPQLLQAMRKLAQTRARALPLTLTLTLTLALTLALALASAPTLTLTLTKCRRCARRARAASRAGRSAAPRGACSRYQPLP